MTAYLFLKVIDLIHGHQLGMLFTGWGLWYLAEVVGFTVVPMVLYVVAAKQRNVRLAQITAFLTAFGVILNRLNIPVIASSGTTRHVTTRPGRKSGSPSRSSAWSCGCSAG